MTDFYDDMDVLCTCKNRADAEEMVLAFAEQNVVDNFNEELSAMNYSPSQILNSWREDGEKSNRYTTLDGYLLCSRLYNYQFYDCVEVIIF